MGRSNSIAKRMGGAHARRKDQGPNYRKVLFSMEDMASFEALLDEVNHVEYEKIDDGRAGRACRGRQKAAGGVLRL